MRYFVIAAAGAVFELAVGSRSLAANDACLEYEPEVVTLTGTITRHMDYGPPNFGEDAAHDEKQRYWRLDLGKPICVNGKNEDSPDMEGESNVRNLQIVYESGYPRGGDWVGHRASVTGTLFHTDNGNHHTKVLIMAARTTKAP